ncbi:MAG TPA: hypothetical protein DDW38_05105 [Psychrobacter sp.]|nr:hypothetical protein [Psychrobacter sp.]
MAIFIASTKSISRGKGQSAVASASYRAGEKLEDKRYGKVHDYSKRYGVMSADIILPSSLKNIGATIERGELWNKAENRKDARVAREWLVNLPHELNKEQRKKLAHTFAQALADRYGVIADCAIHKPTDKEIERGADARNFHAHIMLTTRKAELNDNNEIVLTDKSTAELSDKKRREIKLERMSHEVKEVRQLWERVANEKLAEHGIELIDSRSYKDRQLDIEPQLKMGSVATKKERDKYERELRKAKEAQKKGGHYEIDNTPVTVPGQINAIIKERNELVFNSRKREQKNDRLRTVERATKYIENATNNTVSVNQRIDETKRQLERAERAINNTARTATPNPLEQQYRASVDRREQATAELARQQRRVDRETRRANLEDKRRSERAEQLKLRLAHKLLTATQQDNCLRPGFNDDPNDYPDKYDYRQIEVIKDFVTSLNLQSKYFRDNLTAVKNKIDESFIANNKDLIHLVNHPKQEREQYNERLTAWFEFKEDIDQKRADFNQSIIPKLGGSAGEVGRMTRDIISSFDYIQGLDQFISDDKQTIEARELAKSHRSDTLNRTCQQFKYAYFDVLKLPSGERESYTNALKLTVEEFKNIYGSQLPYEQNKAIDDGLRAFNNDLQRSHRPSRGFSR